jgi:hypothetical protein
MNTRPEALKSWGQGNQFVKLQNSKKSLWELNMNGGGCEIRTRDRCNYFASLWEFRGLTMPSTFFLWIFEKSCRSILLKDNGVNFNKINSY